MAKVDESIMNKIDYATFVNIISNIPSCIFFKDKDLKYQFSSHYWAQLLSEDIIGKTDVDIRKDTENAEKAMESDREILRSKKGHIYTIKSEIDGETSYLELIKEPIINSNGEAIGIVGLINDVTEKTLLQKKIVNISKMQEIQCRQLEASNEELKSTLDKLEKMHETQKMFTASMNHELRSPLNGIIASLQTLMDDKTLNDQQLDYVRNALISSNAMLDIVNELLDFAKYEMKGIGVNKHPFSLKDMLDNVHFLSEKQAKMKGLAFEFKYSDDIPAVFISDEGKIRQIINNIVSNAIKYTESGYVSLDVTYESGRLCFVCSDSGQGMTKESLDSLFTPFVRFNEKKNTGIQGTGLGLSVVKKIVDSLEGKIDVNSTIGKGSVFTITIPVEVSSKNTNIKQSTAKKEDTEIPADFSKITVLCVDDSIVNLKVMQSLLK